MAGSGRGRGHASFTFNIEAIGFGKGAALPDVICKPPPPFPSTDNKPVPLKTGEDEDYMLALKQDLRETMKRMPYFLTVEEEHQEVLKVLEGDDQTETQLFETWEFWMVNVGMLNVTDWFCSKGWIVKILKSITAINKYENHHQVMHSLLRVIVLCMFSDQDWRRLPREMKPKKTTKKGAKSKKAKNFEPKSNLDVIKKIEELEKKDDEEEKSEDEKDKAKEKEGEDDEEAEEPEEYDEEEHEEENDYISSYFDNGEDFGAASDDSMDEATY